MKKFLLPVLTLLVGLGLGYSIPHGAKLSSPEPVFGGSGGVQLDRHFTYGLYAGQTDQFGINSSGSVTTSGTIEATTSKASLFTSATVGSSSSSPAALGSSASAHFIIAAAASTAQASTTAVTANSTIILQQELTTPIAGTTCNSNLATSTVVSAKIASNGFTVTNSYAPATNPQCMAYWVIN